MVTISNDKAAMMIEQALVCAARYRVLASGDSNPLMIRLFEENALWLEGVVTRLKHSSNIFNDAPA
jgi:hypothetical protein